MKNKKNNDIINNAFAILGGGLIIMLAVGSRKLDCITYNNYDIKYNIR